MQPKGAEPLIPSILVVDDERQVHSSLRLRLGERYRLISATSPREALECVAREPLDLCIVDIHMPEMDGFSFIEHAKNLDPALGYVVFSSFDSDDNLRRTIPLNVFDFITKPLPDRGHLEEAIPIWVERTRARRHEATLAKNSEAIFRDLELIRIEKDVETTASESAREALLQTTNILTTAQALLLSANHSLDLIGRNDPRLAGTIRSLQAARKQIDAACLITESHFASAYADRETSPAVIDSCARHAIAIAMRLSKAESRQQTVDYQPLSREIAATGLTGIEFLLVMVPAISQALEIAAQGSTLRVRCEPIARIEQACREFRRDEFMWVNRRNATTSSPGILISILSNGTAPTEDDASNWLRGHPSGALRIPSRGLVHGVQKARGLLGVSVSPKADRFTLILALPA